MASRHLPVCWPIEQELRLVDEIQRQLGGVPTYKDGAEISWEILGRLGGWPLRPSLKDRWTLMRKRQGIVGETSGSGRLMSFAFDDLRAGIRRHYQAGVRIKREADCSAEGAKAAATEGTEDAVHAKSEKKAGGDGTSHQHGSVPRLSDMLLGALGLDLGGGPLWGLAIDGVELSLSPLVQLLHGGAGPPADGDLVDSLSRILLRQLPPGVFSVACVVHDRGRWFLCARCSSWSAVWDPERVASSSGPAYELPPAAHLLLGNAASTCSLFGPPTRDEDGDGGALFVLNACLLLADHHCGMTASVGPPALRWHGPAAARDALQQDLSLRLERAHTIALQRDQLHYEPFLATVGLILDRLGLQADRAKLPLSLAEDQVRWFAGTSLPALAKVRLHMREQAAAPEELSWTFQPGSLHHCLVARRGDKYAPVLAASASADDDDDGGKAGAELHWMVASASHVALNAQPCASPPPTAVALPARVKFQVNWRHFSVHLEGTAPPPPPVPCQSSGVDLTTTDTLDVPSALPNAVLAVDPGSHEMSIKDYREQLLDADGQLSCDIMNALLHVAGLPAGHALMQSTFFGRASRDGGPDGVRGEINKLPPSASIVHVPINSGFHWTYAVVDRAAQAIHWFDSLPGASVCLLAGGGLDERGHFGPTATATADRPHVCSIAVRAVLARCFFGDEGATAVRLVAHPESPRQEGTKNCGMHVALTHELALRCEDPAKIVFDFGPGDCPLARRRLAAKLLQQAVIRPPPTPPPDPQAYTSLAALYSERKGEPGRGSPGLLLLGATPPKLAVQRPLPTTDFVLFNTAADGTHAWLLTAQAAAGAWNFRLPDYTSLHVDGAGVVVAEKDGRCGPVAWQEPGEGGPAAITLHFTCQSFSCGPHAELLLSRPQLPHSTLPAQRGLENLRRNCALNAVLMALYADDELRREVLEAKAPADSVTAMAADVFKGLNVSSTNCVSASALKAAMKRRHAQKSEDRKGAPSYDPADAFETLVTCPCWPRARFSFQGRDIVAQCDDCTAPHSLQPITELAFTTTPSALGRPGPVPLQELFPAYTSGRCRGEYCQRTASSRTEFETLPRTLFLLVGRVTGEAPGVVCYKIPLSETLELRTVGGQAGLYSLVSAIFGLPDHFVTAACDVGTGEWYAFDDARPRKAERSFQAAINDMQGERSLLYAMVWRALDPPPPALPPPPPALLLPTTAASKAAKTKKQKGIKK